VIKLTLSTSAIHIDKEEDLIRRSIFVGYCGLNLK
jgi:hypothetical protein